MSSIITKSMVISQPQDKPEEGIFVLPGGYVDDNNIVHCEVELAPITGNEEEFLANVNTKAYTANIITILLSRCIKRIGFLEEINISLVRDLLVGDREYLIIKLYEITFEQKVAVIIHCPDSSCGKPMDLGLSLDDMKFERKGISNRFFNMQLSDSAVYRHDGIDNRSVEFRLPTGEDQEVVASIAHISETRAINQLLARCIKGIGEITDIDEAIVAELPDLTKSEIEEKMQQLAPQIEIELELVCPECQKPFTIPFDFTSFFFAEMKKNLHNLEREVHFIAWHYHWSEHEILSMTRKKRHRYIRLLRDEIDKTNL